MYNDDGLFGWGPDFDNDGDSDPIDRMKRDDFFGDDADMRSGHEETDWRLFAGDGSEYGLSPDDFDSMEEYEEAIEDAVRAETSGTKDKDGSGGEDLPLRLSLSLEFADGGPYTPMKEEPDADKVRDAAFQRELSRTYVEMRRKNAAIIVGANEQGDRRYEDFHGARAMERMRFIAAGECTAARYLSTDGQMLCASAVADRFDLPFCVPAELDDGKYDLYLLLNELAECDAAFAVRVWEWCLDEFIPALRYREYGRDLVSEVLRNLSYDDGPGSFLDGIVTHMIEKPAFADKILRRCDGDMYNVDRMVAAALQRGESGIAARIFAAALGNENVDVHNILKTIDETVSVCGCLSPRTAAEQFALTVFPLVYAQTDVRIKNKIRGWEERLAQDRADFEENEAEEEDDDETEDDGEEQTDDSSGSWREVMTKFFGIDPADYAAKEDYLSAVEHRIRREYREKLLPVSERAGSRRAKETDPSDEIVYRYCKAGPDYPHGPFYYYFPGDIDVAPGDRVLVPLGADGRETEAVVAAVGTCRGCALPCKAGFVKTVIKKLS